MAKRSPGLYLLAAGAGLTALGFIMRLFETDERDTPHDVPAGLPGVGGVGETRALVLKAPRGKLKDVKTIHARCAEIARLVKAGGTNARVHEIAKTILSAKDGTQWRVKPRDWKGECAALFRAIIDPASPYAIRYTCDMREADTFSSAERTLFLTHAGDCLPGDVLLLTRTRGYQPIESIRVGDEVMGDGVWTTVTKWWDKGTLPTIALRLNNGATLRCTSDHKLFRVPRDGATPGRRTQAEEVRAVDVRPDDELLLADTHPEGARHLDPDLAWLVGTYIADGWLNNDRVHIAGRDRVDGREYGKRDKGPQKDRVAAICAARGIVTSRTEKDIRFRDATLHELMAQCGHGAAQKRLPFTDVDAATARALLDGLMADASTSRAGTVVFSTISATLALQIRELHRILGIRTNIRRVVKHGGFGSNPIFRVSVVRNGAEQGARRAHMIHAKVQAIEVGDIVPVFDIETDTHRFYLPETDLIVHNCDDFAIVFGALLMSVGYPVKLRVVQAKGKDTWSHIYVLAGIPPSSDGPTEWFPLDGAVETKPAGWQAPGAEEAFRYGKPAGMIEKTLDYPVG